MPKFYVDVTITKKERWSVEAADAAAAEKQVFFEGALVSATDYDIAITDLWKAEMPLQGKAAP